jgi:antirestriction protein ArdC
MTRAAAFIELFTAPARHRPSRIAAAENGRAVWRAQPPLETVTIDVSGRIDHAYAFVTAIGATSSTGIPSIDRIEMPPSAQFHDTPVSTAAEGYYGTLLHELVHWTSPVHRCNRGRGTVFGG